MIRLNASLEYITITTSTTDAIGYTIVKNTTSKDKVFQGTVYGSIVTVGTLRVVDSLIPGSRVQITDITIRNNGGSANMVTVNKLIDTLSVPISPTYPLAAGEYIQYTDSTGFQRFNAAGELMTVGATGADGMSAYEIAVANGFIGTEADWLASLVGPVATVNSGTGITVDNTDPANPIINNDVTDFVDLGDVPNSYTGEALKYLRVKADESGLELSNVSGTGDVVGPASSVDNSIARYDGVTGKIIQGSPVIIQDTTGNISGTQKITIGIAATQTGVIELVGSTSGIVLLKVADAAGSWTLTLPTTAGSASQFLQTNGSGITSWQTILGLTDGNKGDITVSSSGTVWTINNDAITTVKILDSNVTLAKIANIADQTILGNNTGGAAAPIALTASQTKVVLSLNNVENTALSTWAGSTNLVTLGTVTTGTWSGTSIAPNKGGTGLTTIAAGSILAANTLDTLTAITSTTGLKALQISGTTVSWNTSTGTGNSVFATSPSFVTSIIGSTTMAVFNTVSTTINAFNAATSVNIGNLGTLVNQVINIGGATMIGLGSAQINIGVNTGENNNLGVDIGNQIGNVTIGIAAGVSVTSIKTIDIGTGGDSGSETNITVGSSTAGNQNRFVLYAETQLKINLGSDATGDIFYRNSSGDIERLGVGPNGYVLTLAAGLPSWAAPSGSGTVTSVSVVSANGFAGSVATATTTPAITISTTISGLLKGNGTAISAAAAGTDYAAGTAALGTGIVKSTTGTGALTIAIAADFPTLNQNTTGTAAALTTPRAIYGNNFDGTAALTQIITSVYGGTGNGFTKFTGPTTTEKTFTLPDATCTILTTNAAVTVAQGGTGAASLTAYAVLCGGTTGTNPVQSIASVGTAGQVLTSNGAGALPTFQPAAGGGGGVTSLDSGTGILTLGGVIAGLSAKNPPVDADTFVISDSAAANASKKLTWANIKTAIATFLGWQSNADGGQFTVGTVPRLLKWLGADITLTGAGTRTIATYGGADALMECVYFAELQADFTLSAVNTAQNAFPSTVDVITLEANTTYEIELMYHITCGTASHTVGISFVQTTLTLDTGTGLRPFTLDVEAYNAIANTTITTKNMTYVTQTSNTVVTPAATTAGNHAKGKGVIRVATGGTLTPQITFSANPTGTNTMNAGSYIKIWARGSNTVVFKGPFS